MLIYCALFVLYSKFFKPAPSSTQAFFRPCQIKNICDAATSRLPTSCLPSSKVCTLRQSSLLCKALLALYIETFTTSSLLGSKNQSNPKMLFKRISQIPPLKLASTIHRFSRPRQYSKPQDSGHQGVVLALRFLASMPSYIYSSC